MKSDADGLTHAIVTWVNGEGSECQIEGALQLVDAEQVIVTITQHAVCCIPRRSVTRIESRGKSVPAKSAESSVSSIPTPAITSVKSVVSDGTADARDINGVVMNSD